MLARKRLSKGLTLSFVYVAVLTALLGLAGCASTHVASGDSPAPGKITVTTSSLPTGQTGNTYTSTLQAQGGTPPYKWSLTSGTLPAGLSLNSATGVISGTPTQSVANLSLSFTVTDSSATPLSASFTLSLTVTAASSGITITTQSLPNGQINVAYSATLAATGGTAPYTWTLTGGALAAGLTLNGATGAITGTPTAAASATALTFKVTDSSSPALTQTASLTMTIFPAGLVITTTSLPNGQVNAAYSAALTAVGGTSPYTWSLTSGTLPTGLSLNTSAGAIIGTPTASVNAVSLTFKVTDASAPALTQTVTLQLTITPAPLVITTTLLPNGEITMPYNATLAATGGTTPYTWKLTSGTLPAGLSLNAATGAITGTPTTTVTNASLTFMVSDSAVPALTKSANLTLTITGLGTFTVSVSPLRAALTTTQTLNITATTNDPAGVTWTATGGSFSSPTTATGMPVVYTAPATPGTYTVKSTSVSDGSDSASTTIYVTDLAGVYTYHNDLARDGVNAQEYALSTSNVKTSFGKLFSCQADGAIYAQPLWVANVAISGGTHNVVVAATMRDSVYVFDADATSCVTYWHMILIPSGETYGSYADVNSSDIYPDIGILGTPVIDSSSGMIYLITKTKTISTGVYHQRLHALKLADGSEPIPAVDLTSAITVPGSGDTGDSTCSSSSGSVPFCPQRLNQRPGLALLNGVVYVAWASHGDVQPYHGWLIGFNASTLTRTTTYNASPNGREAGIWMSGGAPAVDSSNNLYVITGNGDYNGTSDFGDTLLKLGTSGGLSRLDSFTPSNQASLDAVDLDFGSGASVVLVDLPGAPVPHLVVGGGKGTSGNSFAGELYVLNRDALGGYQQGPGGTDNVVQEFSFNQPIFATPAFWQNTLYIAGVFGPLKAFTLNTSTSQLNQTPVQSSSTFGFPGATPSISASGTTNGVVWAIDAGVYGTRDGQSVAAGPAILHAFDATNVATELWNSASVSGDAAGNAVKFTVPTVANGRVYVGTRGNDNTIGSGTVFGEIDVYGLKPN